jgi:hypothetical protein
VQQNSIKFEFEMHQIHSNAIEKRLLKLKTDTLLFSLLQPSWPFPLRGSPARAGSSRSRMAQASGLLRPGPRAPAHGSAGARGSGPSQPGLEPPFRSPAWAKSSPHKRGTISAVGSRSTNARGFRRIKTARRSPSPEP